MEEEVVLLVSEGDHGKAELAEEERAMEDRCVAEFGEWLFTLEALSSFEADDGIFGVRRVSSDADYLGGADGGLADVGVVDDAVLALLHIAEGDQGLGILDAVPGGFAVAEEIVEGVFVGFGFEKVRHGLQGTGSASVSRRDR